METQTTIAYSTVVGIIERQVVKLNDLLGLTDEPHDLQVSFGYTGDLSADDVFDTREWYVLLPHPNRVGQTFDRIGGFRAGDEGGARACASAMVGVLILAENLKNNGEALLSGPEPIFCERPPTDPEEHAKWTAELHAETIRVMDADPVAGEVRPEEVP